MVGLQNHSGVGNIYAAGNVPQQESMLFNDSRNNLIMNSI